MSKSQHSDWFCFLWQVIKEIPGHRCENGFHLIGYDSPEPAPANCFNHFPKCCIFTSSLHYVSTIKYGGGKTFN